MEYVIQQNLYQMRHDDMLKETLGRMGLKWYGFKHVPFTEDLIFEEEPTGNNVMVFGSVRVSHFSTKRGWTPGSFYNENHDYTVYSQHWKENMLNWDSRIQKMTDPIEEDYFFARPTGDSKVFKGELYGRAIWNLAVANGIANGADPDTLIQVCRPKEIFQEVRCFVIKGKVVTASYYKIGSRVVYQECFEDDVLAFAQDMVSIYQLSEAFVIDICRTPDGLKIVECNCINCSGFYDINFYKFIETLEENFNV